MMGGRGIIANNIFAGNGYDGEEAVNVKSGCHVDVGPTTPCTRPTPTA